MFVTGEDTVAVLVDLRTPGGGTGTTLQGVNSTSEILLTTPLNFTVNVPQTAGVVPYEFGALLVSRFPGAVLWLNLASSGNDAYAAAVAAKIAAYIGPDNDVYLEHGNEHWNFAGGFYQWGQYLQETNLTAYPPSGTLLLGYYTMTGAVLVAGR